MNARKSRLQRKASRILRSDADRDLDVRLGRARAAFNERTTEIASKHRDDVAALEAARRKAVKEATDEFDKTRSKIITELAEKERAA